MDLNNSSKTFSTRRTEPFPKENNNFEPQSAHKKNNLDQNRKTLPFPKQNPNNETKYVPFVNSCFELILNYFDDGVENVEYREKLNEESKRNYIRQIFTEKIGKEALSGVLEDELASLVEEFGLNVSWLGKESAQNPKKKNPDRFKIEDPYIGRLQTKRLVFSYFVK